MASRQVFHGVLDARCFGRLAGLDLAGWPHHDVAELVEGFAAQGAGQRGVGLAVHALLLVAFGAGLGVGGDEQAGRIVLPANGAGGSRAAGQPAQTGRRGLRGRDGGFRQQLLTRFGRKC